MPVRNGTMWHLNWKVQVYMIKKYLYILYIHVPKQLSFFFWGWLLPCNWWRLCPTWFPRFARFQPRQISSEESMVLFHREKLKKLVRSLRQPKWYLYNLVTGFNQIEKYDRQIGSFPQGSGWKKMKPPPSNVYVTLCNQKQRNPPKEPMMVLPLVL